MAARPADEWPPHTTQTVPWRQTHRAGSKADRTLTSVDVSLPPLIAGRALQFSGQLAAKLDTATREITTLDQRHGGDLGPLGTLLLRTESVASSKIERVQATIDDYARALHGTKANASAWSMVAATKALGVMIDDVGRTGTIDLEAITAAHRALMVDDPYEHDEAGRFRTVQNWIGGNDHSPRMAMYVPPPPEAVGTYVADLIEFVNRDDLPPLAQAAIAHAQFESIHPFTDGNGRIGRALVNTVLRRRRATSHVVVPLASSLVARRERYFATLGSYREGSPAPIIEAFATAATIAARESQQSAETLFRAPETMRGLVGSVRKGSATERLLELVLSTPVITAEDAIAALGAAGSTVYEALTRLETAGVLRPLTDRRRNQVWGATVVLDELEDLGLRIESDSR